MTRLDLGVLRDVAPRFFERDGADSESYPQNNLGDLWQLGLFQAPYPTALGGSDWSLVDCVDATEAVAAHSPSTALLLIMPLGLAGVTALTDDAAPAAHRVAWAEQRERLAADYARHRFYAACNSERGAGGALEATQTVAARNGDGGFRLNGDKILSSGGEHADVFFSSAKVSDEDLPGSGVVEFVRDERDSAGVTVANDWDGFGMRSTESQSVSYVDAPSQAIVGFPNFLEALAPTTYWYCLMGAISVGCAAGILRLLGDPAPASPALRSRFADAQMRLEAMRAYVREVAREWQPAAPPAYSQRVVRMKTYVTAQAVTLGAELFSLGGGRHYRRSDAAGRLLRDSFAGTALRPPLGATLDALAEQFEV
jgi:alkylation response protein AidB-like acyl-CoA dehydrogenase